MEPSKNKTGQTNKGIRKENKGKRTKTANKRIETAKNKVNRAKLKLNNARSKYGKLESKAIGIRAELKETKKSHPYYGLTERQMSKQFTKFRHPETPGAQRVAEADIKKTISSVKMLKHAVRRGFRADYVLTDSWFYNYELIKTISKLNKKQKINLISMAKMGKTKYGLMANGKFYNAKGLLKKFKGEVVKARSHKAKYIKVPVAHGDIRINLFFRECKQYLNLGKSKSTCFGSQIADATISLTQYVILSFHRRILDYSSFDGIFASALEDALQHSIASKLQKMFFIIIEFFSGLAGVDVIKLTRSFYRDGQTRIKMKNLNPTFYEILEKHEAA